MNWLIHNYREIIATLVSVGAVSGLWTWFHSWRARRLEERRAAAALIPAATSYKLYWIAKHDDELNAQFDPNEPIQWGGDPFTPILITSALEAIASRLSKTLRNKVFALQALSHKWKSDIATAYEYDTEDIDIVGPLAVAQLAMASDELLKALAREAQVSDPETGHDVDFIRSKANAWSKDRLEWHEARKAFNAKLWASTSKKSGLESSELSKSS